MLGNDEAALWGCHGVVWVHGEDVEWHWPDSVAIRFSWSFSRNCGLVWLHTFKHDFGFWPKSFFFFFGKHMILVLSALSCNRIISFSLHV